MEKDYKEYLENIEELKREVKFVEKNINELTQEYNDNLKQKEALLTNLRQQLKNMEKKYVFDISLKELIEELENEFGEKIDYEVELDNAVVCNKRRMTKNQIIDVFVEQGLDLVVSVSIKGKEFNQIYFLKGYSISNKSFINGGSIKDNCHVSYEKDVNLLGYHYSELKLNNESLENLICHFRYNDLFEVKKIVEDENKLKITSAVLNCLEKTENKLEKPAERVRK